MDPKYDLSPQGFEKHQRWVDSLVESPLKPHLPSYNFKLLTVLDASTEHVLRGSKSFAARSWKSRASGSSLRVPSNKENYGTALAPERPSFTQHASALAPVLGEIAANNQQIPRAGPYSKFRRSPTPSLKRKKVEAIVRAHGSPTHVRVTAGGRIVPSEQSPLCHPRYGYSAIKTNGGLVKFAPNHPMGKSQWTQATQNGFVAQDADGRLCQIVDGTILPLKEIDGALQLYMPAPNLNVTQRGSSAVAVPSSRVTHVIDPGNHIMPQAGPPQAPKPSVQAQINALELEYSKLDHELKDVDKTEVLHGRTMGRTAKDALITKRRELVLSLDNVRKALKSLKQQLPPLGSPTLPDTRQPTQGPLPPRNRLPPFLQQRQDFQEMQLPHPQSVHGTFLGPQPLLAGPYGFVPAPSQDSAYSVLPWVMPPPSLFMPPPTFDGSVSITSLPASVPFTSSLTSNAVSEAIPVTSCAAQPEPNGVPQNDGSRSSWDLQAIPSPRQSHALPIKMPEEKSAAGLRSALNPMSPEYRPMGVGATNASPPMDKQIIAPIKPKASTPPSPLWQPQVPGPESKRTAQTSDVTTSPSKKATHLHSSSVSSFETADFFPRNTHEYSTRQHSHASPGQAEDRDHIGRDRVSHDMSATASNQTVDGSPPRGSVSADLPSTPPGTPISRNDGMRPAPLQIVVDGTSWERRSQGFDVSTIPDRSSHNLSPKAKRNEWLFVEERPGLEHTGHFSSRAEDPPCGDELCVHSSPQDTIDFSKKSGDWIEGYQAGLNRHPVGASRMGEFLDGYCSGLLKSSTTIIGSSTGSPSKPTSRRPSPVPVHPRPSPGMQAASRTQASDRPIAPPKEIMLPSMVTFKQAMFAPHNENTILTPSADGPHINEARFHLGNWTKDRSALPPLSHPPPCAFDESTGQVERGRVTSGSITPLVHVLRSGNIVPTRVSSPAMSAKGLAPRSIAKNGEDGRRVSSGSASEARFYRQWPGSRVVSPQLEWKSGSSVSHQTGLATGFFAHAQFDGERATPDSLSFLHADLAS